MKRISSWAWLPAAGLLLAGCGEKSREGSVQVENAPLAEPPMVSECEPGVRGGRLVIAQLGDPKTFNPITANETSSTDVLLRLFASLVWVDVPTQRFIPYLAESWTVDPDNRTWTFKLRKKLQWSDGQPLTADDVVFTWEVVYAPHINNVSRDQFLMNGRPFTVTKIDETTVRIVTPEVYAPFLQFAGVVPIIPRHKLQASTRGTNTFESAYGVNTRSHDLVGSGPYRLKEFKPAQLTVLERNPYYFVVDKKGQRLPYIDELVYTVSPNQDAISLRTLAGESDIQELVRPDEYDRFKAEADKGKIKLLDLGLATERDFISFNQNTNVDAKTGKPYVDPAKLKWFRHAKFRQAVSYAIDRPAIVRATLGGHGQPNYNYTPFSAWYNSNIVTYPHNPARAKQLLAEIGIQDRNNDGQLEDDGGRPIEFVLISNAGNTRREKGAIIIQEDLKRLGMKITFQPMQFNALVTRLDSTFDYECFFLGWGGGPPDPAYGLNILKSDGFTHQWFPRQKRPATEWEARIDKLCVKQLQTLDFAERKKYYDEIQMILSEQQPMIFLTAMKAYSAIRPDLQNVRASTLDPSRVIWNIEEHWLKK